MTEAPRTRTPARVVEIGAPAGRLDAVDRFFHHVPSDTGMDGFEVARRLRRDPDGGARPRP